MKNKLSLFVVIAAVALAFSSCKSLTNFSIEKRQHRGGYYVDWGNGKVKTEPVQSSPARHSHALDEKKVNAPAPSKPVQAEPANETTTPAEKKPAKAEPQFPHNLFKVAQVPVAQREELSIEMTREAMHEFSDSRGEMTGGQPTWLMILLCLFIPPLAIALAEGVGTPFWIDLILAVLGLGVISSGFFGLFWLAAVIYAFIVIF